VEPVGFHQGSNAVLIIQLRYHNHLTLQPVLIFIRKLPNSAENDTERAKLTALAESGLEIIRSASSPG